MRSADRLRAENFDVADIRRPAPEYVLDTGGIVAAADLLRPRHAYRLLSQGVPPSEVAVVVGYADQAHLTRELRRIRGETPARILAASTR